MTPHSSPGDIKPDAGAQATAYEAVLKHIDQAISALLPLTPADDCATDDLDRLTTIRVVVACSARIWRVEANREFAQIVAEIDAVDCATPGVCTCPHMPRCPSCGHTAHDCAHLMDHRFCDQPDPSSLAERAVASLMER